MPAATILKEAVAFTTGGVHRGGLRAPTLGTLFLQPLHLQSRRTRSPGQKACEAAVTCPLAWSHESGLESCPTHYDKHMGESSKYTKPD